MRYIIAPLDITDEQFHIYKLLYKKANFQTMEVNYTKDQLLIDSNSIFNLTERKVRTILKFLLDNGMIIELSKGCKGKPTKYKIVNMTELMRQQCDSNVSAMRQECVSNDVVIPTVSEVERQENDSNVSAMRQENVSPIKDKDKDKDKDNKYIYSEIDIKEVRDLYKGTKVAKSKPKLLKLMKQYTKEQIIRTIERYNLFVENERKNGFKTLQYKNESTFWNGGFLDYLDENYQEVKDGPSKQINKPTQKPIEGEGEELARRAIEKYGDRLDDYKCDF